ncbi:hypothetical protein ALC62_13830, partial [Cyphomyrmex costatus]
RHLPLEESNEERVDVADPCEISGCVDLADRGRDGIQRNVLIRNQSRELPLPLRRIAASFFRCLFSMPLLPMVVLLVAADLAANESISRDQQLLPATLSFDIAAVQLETERYLQMEIFRVDKD